MHISFLFLSLSTFFNSSFLLLYEDSHPDSLISPQIPRVPTHVFFVPNLIPRIPTLPRIPTHISCIHIISTLIPRIPTLIHRIHIIPTLILCIPTLIPYTPIIFALIPGILTLIPSIVIIPLIPFPDSPFRFLQIAR